MAKTFIQNGTGSTATLQETDNNVIKIYDTIENAQAAISMLEEGEIISADNALFQKVGNELKTICRGDSAAVGTIISMHNNNITPAGYLLCDGRDTTGTTDELETKYPLLYGYLGHSNVLPISYNKDSLPEKPQIAIQNRSDYIPTGWTYGGTNPTWIPTIQEFTADGYLYIYTDDYCFLWIQDSDGTIHGYTVGDRDNVGNDVWVPIKKGGKIYGLNRNGTSTPAPSTEIANYDYTKIAIYYYTEYNYIRALSGVETAEESQAVVNAIVQAESDLEQVVTDTADAIVGTAINTKLADKTTLVEMANNYTNIPANTALSDSILNYEEVWFYGRRSASANSIFIPIMKVTHEQVVDFLAITASYSILFAWYENEWRELKFNSTGDTITAVAGSGCIYKIVGYMKRS